MKYEVLKRSHLKRNIIIALIVIGVISAIVLNFTRAKYRTTQSIPLIQGTINYSPSDLNIVAMYLNQDGAIPAGETDIAPKFGYTLNEEQSFCEVNDEKIDDASILYEEGYLYFNKLNRKGTKCSVYFDLIPDSENPTLSISTTSTDNSITVVANATDNIGIYYYYYKLDNEEEIRIEENSYTFEELEKDSVHTITVRVEDAAGNEVSTSKEVTVGLKGGGFILASSNPPTGQTTDWTGQTTYYYTGKPNNWVQFAGFWWRIIRINGDGSIRMIRTTANETGTGTQIQTSEFNYSYNNNAYVGYMYQSGQVHGLEASSNIKDALDIWYQNNLADEAEYIDGNAGFCGDRTPSTSRYSSNGSGGTGTTTTYYGAYIRLYSNSNPSLQCETEDIYTTEGSSTGNKALDKPVGLVTADEAALTGITYNNANTGSYLYTAQDYWTMSPFSYTYNQYFGASVFRVSDGGSLGSNGPTNEYGVRPVINLKSIIPLSGTGTTYDPFVVVS